MTLVFAIGMGLLTGTVVVSILSSRLAAAAAVGGTVLIAVVGIAAAAGGPHPTLALGTWLGFGPSALTCDGLAGIFLGLAGVTGAAVSLTLLERPPRRFIIGLHGLLLLTTATVIVASQAFLFLLAWELLSLSIYLLATADRDRPGNLLAGYFTFGVTKVGGAALLAAFALLYGHTGSFQFAHWASAPIDAGTRGVAFALLLAGFGTKIGIVPVQGAVPVGYDAAPGATAASLSVALAAGFYGLWRLVFDVLGPAQLWWGDTVLVLGAITAFGGILYAIAQDELRRFLGFSTIEHTGIALLGLGVALLGQAVHSPKLAAAGLLAGTLHLVAHGLGKTLAFLSIERVERSTSTREMRPLGGIARLMPRSAIGFGLATLTLAAIPPFGGFVSEWLTFEALLQGFRLDSTASRLLMALAAAALALTAGLAVLAFAKAYGFVFLGRARSALARVHEPGGPAIGLALLTVITLGLGVVAPWEIHLIGSGLASTLGFDLSTTTISHPLVLGPVFEKFSVLAPTWLAIVIPAFSLIALLFVLARRHPGVRRAPVWVTGSRADIGVVQYKPAAYSNPIRVVLRGPYRYRRELREQPGARSPLQATLVLETRVVLAVEQYLYQPLARAALAISSRVKLVQSGRLGTYLLYMLAVLIIVLAMIPSLNH